MKDLVFENNVSKKGGALYLNYLKNLLEFSDIKFKNNFSESTGGALLIVNSENCDMIKNL